MSASVHVECEVSTHRRIVYAETRAAHWLAEGNRFSESGRGDKAEAAYRKSQFWLDRLNKAEGRA